MSFSEPIELRSLSDHAFEKIVGAIMRGELEPGERISEAVVAKRLGISHGPLREAMGRLEAHKLVQRKPRVGVRVAELSLDDLDDLFAMREALEGMAARMAAVNMTPVEMSELSQLMEQHGRDEDVRAGRSYYQGSQDDDFHFCIVRGSRNARLIQALCHELYYLLRIYRFRSSQGPGRATRAFEEHGRIVEAIASHEPDAAEAAMRQHIANARANLVWQEASPSQTP